MYVKYENNEFKGRYFSLPKQYKNVSGFDKLSDQDLAKYGFYPLVEDKTKTPKDNSHKNSTYKIVKNKVVETKHFRELTQAEVNKKNMQELNICLSACKDALRKSDYLLLEDAPIDSKTKTALLTMRAKLYAMQSDNTLVKEDTRDKLQNFLNNLQNNIIEPVEL